MFRADVDDSTGTSLRMTTTFIKVRHAGQKVSFRVTASYMFRDLKEDVCEHW